ncbi:hypothetical protein DFH94DRAFT_792501 [Russula ochroleuca]|uniref:Macrofage activating glycoprotein n=1 Tax=Russula ochroleuca TaxID=152965 RepID=A0A9P5N1D0_9AGAM|nr:hypothetical protein DFH94DRAFT_792501 [Russula ochroleuca]
MFSTVLPLAFLLANVGVNAQTYTATYLPSNAPAQTEQGQAGTNQCGTGSNQTSNCQNAYINSLDDFCIFAPPEPGAASVIGNTEQIEVAWCLKSGYGTRLIPDGTITGAHFVKTPDYVQVTGVGDLTKVNIPAGDAGGELDPHGATGNGNPIGGLVFSSAFTGQAEQLHEWTNFVAADQFCFRGCQDAPQAPGLCNHIYDEMGCAWNMPGNYNPGFDACQGDSGPAMGVIGGSTFQQGQPNTPAAQPAPASSSCVTSSTIGNQLAYPTNSTSSTAAKSTATSGSASKTASGTGASNTSKPNSALALHLPNGGSIVAVIGIFLILTLMNIPYPGYSSIVSALTFHI